MDYCTVVYNPVHNEFVVNTYRPVNDYIDEVSTLVEKQIIWFLHGYLLAIYNYYKELDSCANFSL